MNLCAASPLRDGIFLSSLSYLNVSVDNKSGSLISTAKVEGDSLVIATRKLCKKIYDAKDNWPNYIAFLEPAYKFSRARIGLKKK